MITFWLIVSIAAIIIEIVTLGNLICIWFSVGALVSALLAWLKIKVLFQYIAFFVVSIITMLIVRPLAAKYLRGNTVPTNSDRFIGKIGKVTKDITAESWGEVTIQGIVWSAIGIDNQEIKKDTRVRVMAIEGVKLIVKPIED
ncbi:MAG: NfeD family protein [Erysipelotrichaceae bacterium]|nr:NfeD family protein [Erysipelotrichaceae bacterium]